MTPEVLRGEPVTLATDLYAVGEVLTGRHPFEAATVLGIVHRKLLGTAARPVDFVPGVPEDLDRLCVARVDRDPARRPAAGEILRELRPDEVDGTVLLPSA